MGAFASLYLVISFNLDISTFWAADLTEKEFEAKTSLSAIHVSVVFLHNHHNVGPGSTSQLTSHPVLMS